MSTFGWDLFCGIELNTCPVSLSEKVRKFVKRQWSIAISRIFLTKPKSWRQVLKYCNFTLKIREMTVVNWPLRFPEFFSQNKNPRKNPNVFQSLRICEMMVILWFPEFFLDIKISRQSQFLKYSNFTRTSKINIISKIATVRWLRSISLVKLTYAIERRIRIRKRQIRGYSGSVQPVQQKLYVIFAML